MISHSVENNFSDNIFFDTDLSTVLKPEEKGKAALASLSNKQRQRYMRDTKSTDVHTYSLLADTDKLPASLIKGYTNPSHPDLKYPFPGEEFTCHCKFTSSVWKRIAFFFEGRYKKKQAEHEGEVDKWHTDMANHMDDVTGVYSRELTRAAYMQLLQGNLDLASSLANQAYEKSLIKYNHTSKKPQDLNQENALAIAIEAITSFKKHNLEEAKEKLLKFQELKVNSTLNARQNAFLNQVVFYIASTEFQEPLESSSDFVNAIKVQHLKTLSSSSIESSESIKKLQGSIYLKSMTEAIITNLDFIKKHQMWDQFEFACDFKDETKPICLSHDWIRGLIRELSLPKKFSTETLSKEYYDNCIQIQLSRILFEVDFLMQFHSDEINSNFFEKISHLIGPSELSYPEETEYKIPQGPRSLAEDWDEIWGIIKKVIAAIIEVKNEMDKAKAASHENSIEEL